MNHEPVEASTSPEAVIDALLLQQAQVAGDLVEITSTTWAIHGVIPVDGDVILAEFSGRASAQDALDHLGLPANQP